MSSRPPHRTNPTLRAINIPTTLILAGVTFVGAFSRLTSGSYTPQWYAYQLERAGNTAGTPQQWLIPTFDVALGAMLLNRTTRRVAAAGVTVMALVGLGIRVAEGKAFTTDAAFVGLAVLVFGTS
ncbi:hypothetical protein R3P38DRAFT_3221454 [Favolaschia claudopus]|uniref:Uncharacterized protein n=1 Tax=Favolaschia claudopus TaxID=2862362 RepID=A0AAW0A0C6_9AGAR